MKNYLWIWAVAALCIFGGFVRAADDPRTAKLEAADNDRIAATIAADKARMQEVFSDELHYAHSSGNVDTKASLIDTVASGKLKYLSLKYQHREFSFPAPGIALMTGKVDVKIISPTGEHVESTFSFLAAWREEQGHWHMLAWQSARLTPPPQPAK